MNPKDRKALEVAREALQWHSSGQARDALALIDERLQADEPNENPARPILEGWKLDRREDGSIGILGPVGGCIIDRKLLDYLGVHSVVLYALAEALLAVDGLPSRSQADEKEEPVAWRYQDARGHYRYRSYVPLFDQDYKILNPIPLYAIPEGCSVVEKAELQRIAVRIESFCYQLGTSDMTVAKELQQIAFDLTRTGEPNGQG